MWIVESYHTVVLFNRPFVNGTLFEMQKQNPEKNINLYYLKISMFMPCINLFLGAEQKVCKVI
jgi:hypothetical protein